MRVNCKYIECSPIEFREHFYPLWNRINYVIQNDLLIDKNYIVRITSDGLVEFGYPGDEWYIK